MSARQRFLVIHMSDPAAAEWDPAIEGPRMDAWLARREGPDGWNPNGETVAGADSARRITAHDGEVVVTQGPFPEFKEWFLGVEWIEAASIDEATRMLETHPTARIGRMYLVPTRGAEEES